MARSRVLDLNSLRIHQLEGYIQNITLIEQEGRLLLFDSGCINDVKRIKRYCRESLKRSPADIKLTAVTHIHPDHAGGAVCLRKKFGIPIAAHKDVDRWYRGWAGCCSTSWTATWLPVWPFAIAAGWSKSITAVQLILIILWKMVRHCLFPGMESNACTGTYCS